MLTEPVGCQAADGASVEQSDLTGAMQQLNGVAALRDGAVLRFGGPFQAKYFNRRVMPQTEAPARKSAPAPGDSTAAGLMGTRMGTSAGLAQSPGFFGRIKRMIFGSR